MNWPIALQAGIGYVSNSSGTYMRVPDGVKVQGVVTDPFTWMWLTTWSILGILITFVLIGVLAWYIYDTKVRTPLEAQKIKEAHLNKKPLEIVEHDSGYIEFLVGARTGPEGVVSTKPVGKYEKHWTGFFARESTSGKEMNVPDNATDKQKTEAATTNALSEMLGDATRQRRILKGAKIPVNFGYSGKAVLTNLTSLAMLKIIDDLAKLQPDQMVYVNIGALKALLMPLIAIGIFFGGLAALIAVAYFFTH